MYVNGLMTARISSCCEYRYSPGFQQGSRGCFRLAWLSGGLPCHRSTAFKRICRVRNIICVGWVGGWGPGAGGGGVQASPNGTAVEVSVCFTVDEVKNTFIFS